MKSAESASSRVSRRFIPTLYWCAYMLTCALLPTVTVGGVALRNASRDRPPNGSGYDGFWIVIDLACGHVSSLKFCSVRMLS